MQYVTKFATEDKIQQKSKCTQIRSDPYFDKHGVLKPGYCNQFEVNHFALLALFQWGQENAHVKKELYKKHKLRFITQKTPFDYEVQILVSMMHWDTFNKSFKFGCIMGHLNKKETSFEKLREKADLMLKEEERLSTAKFKRGMRYGRNFYAAVRIKFHAAVRIQEWWLRKKRKFRIYKNLYQLMDEYSVEGGFTGQDSRKYLGMGKNLLKIQEDIMKKVEMRRKKCREVSKNLIGTLLDGAIYRKVVQPRVCTTWEERCLEMIKSLPSVPTTDPYCECGAAPPPPCDEGPVGPEAAEAAAEEPSCTGSSARWAARRVGWSGKWLRRLGLTK
jgi:hypothetical protein